MKFIVDIPQDIRLAIDQMGLLRIPGEMIKVVDGAIQHSIPLDKIRAEIELRREEISNKKFLNDELQVYYDGRNDGLKDARYVVDKYKYMDMVESEVQK